MVVEETERKCFAVLFKVGFIKISSQNSRSHKFISAFVFKATMMPVVFGAGFSQCC